jgi:hypothetical protein
MKKKSFFGIALLGLILIVALTASFSSPVKTTKVCKQNPDSECSNKTKKTVPGNLIWENLSREFISFTSFSY